MTCQLLGRVPSLTRLEIPVAQGCCRPEQEAPAFDRTAAQQATTPQGLKQHPRRSSGFVGPGWAGLHWVFCSLQVTRSKSRHWLGGVLSRRLRAGPASKRVLVRRVSSQLLARDAHFPLASSRALSGYHSQSTARAPHLHSQQPPTGSFLWFKSLALPSVASCRSLCF